MPRTDGNIIIGTSVDVGGLNSALHKIEGSFKRLGKLTAGKAFGAGALVALGKAALDAASDLQEVQNVVDVSFTKTIGTVEALGDSVAGMGYVIKQTADGVDVYVEDMTWKIEGFAKTCVERFGMSEFAAKQTAGSFMAMGKSMGLSMEEASNMSVKLTGLTGDFASFYNISQDYARVALSAVYTGETETLKRYGIVLTEANLQQFALSQGITDNVKKMDARSKAILRYQYIMKATADMEGDFVRTQGTWANQTRVLQQVWNQFLVTLGNGLISVLTPLVQVLNAIIVKLTQFVKTLWQILSNIFGFSLQDLTDQANGVAGGFDNAADGAEDLADGITKAGKAAKKHLANFDELNNITTPSSSSADASGAGGLSLGDIDLGELGNIEDAVDDIWSKIDNLYDLGKFIGETISNALESIDWDSIYEHARNFGTGLAEFLNGLISTDLFKDLGHTIAGALNTVIYSALAFGTTFDWSQFGIKLAAGINEFFATFDFASLARSINAWVQGIFTTIKELLTNVDWKNVFLGIKEFLSNLDPETLAILIGFGVLSKTIKYVVSQHILKAFASGIGKGLGLVPLKTLFKNFGVSLGQAWAAIDWANIINSHQALIIIQKTLGQITSAWAAGVKLLFKPMQVFTKTFIENVQFGVSSALKQAFSAANMAGLNSSLTFMSTGIKLLAGIPAIIAGIVTAATSFFDMWNNGWSLAKTVIEGIGIALVAIGAIILGAPAAVAGIVAAVVFAVSQIALFIKEHWDSIKEIFSKAGDFIKEKFGGIAQTVINAFINIGTAIKNFFEPIISFFSGMFTRIGQFAEGCWIVIKAIFIKVKDWFNQHVITPLSSAFSAVTTAIGNLFSALWSKVTTWTSNAVNSIKSVWGSITSFFSPIANAVVNIWNNVSNSIRNALTSAFNTVSGVVRSVFNGIASMVERIINGVINAINSFLRGFNNFVAGAAKITGDSWGGVSLLNNISLPRLAKGAVIPPNKEFMAILGDQKSGTNIEAPLDTIKQALAETLAQFGGVSGGSEDIVINIDGYEVFRAVRRQNDLFTKSTGKNAFI